MFHIQTLNKISPVGLNKFDPANYTVDAPETTPDAIMVRSASMHDMKMPESLLAIARAGAGVNNIPVADCAQKGIVVFNTPGANANAVKELVLCGMLLASRKVTRAIDWCKTIKDEGDNVPKTVEKGKSAFAGPELKGKTLAVIGLGAIGRLVANAAVDLGMQVIGYDPFLKDASVLKPGVTVNNDLDQVFPLADYITVHVPLTPDTKELICAESIAKMKDTVRVMNFARGDLANADDVVEALEEGMRYIDTVTAHFRPAMNGEVYFTGEDVCRMLHITSRTLQGYRTQRLIPYISLPGKTLYRQSDLLRMLEENYVDMRQKRKRGKSPT